MNLYYTLRLDSALAQQVKHAARLKGVTESRFIRDVVADQARATIARANTSIWEQMEDLVDVVGTGERVASTADSVFEPPW